MAKTAESARLEAKNWTRAGLEVLAERGPEGVKVEALARRLGVTKGSFYWHFKDRDALLEAMLADWRRRATLAIIDRFERVSGDAATRLVHLLRLPTTDKSSEWGADMELAIRLWGRRDPRARAALEEVDQVRLRYIGGLLSEAGAPPAEVPARAILAYSYMRVFASLIDREDEGLMARCEAVLLGR